MGFGSSGKLTFGCFKIPLRGFSSFLSRGGDTTRTCLSSGGVCWDSRPRDSSSGGPDGLESGGDQESLNGRASVAVLVSRVGEEDRDLFSTTTGVSFSFSLSVVFKAASWSLRCRSSEVSFGLKAFESRRLRVDFLASSESDDEITAS